MSYQAIGLGEQLSKYMLHLRDRGRRELHFASSQLQFHPEQYQQVSLSDHFGAVMDLMPRKIKQCLDFFFQEDKISILYFFTYIRQVQLVRVLAGW